MTSVDRKWVPLGTLFNLGREKVAQSKIWRVRSISERWYLFFTIKKTGITKSICTPVCINAEPNRYPTNLVYVFESLLVILLTLESRIVGLLSDLVVLTMIPLTSKNQHRGFKF